MAQRDVVTQIQYGMGATCQATLPESQVSGRSVRELIRTVATIDQPNEPARRTARVLSDVITSGRSVDVEFSEGARDQKSRKEQFELDEIVFVDQEQQAEATKTLNIHVSEAYIGG